MSRSSGTESRRGIPLPPEVALIRAGTEGTRAGRDLCHRDSAAPNLKIAADRALNPEDPRFGRRTRVEAIVADDILSTNVLGVDRRDAGASYRDTAFPRSPLDGHRHRERARQIKVDLNTLGGLEIDPHGAQFRVVEVNGLENSELRLGIFEQLERWERKGFYRCRRFVLRPTALVIGRRAVAKVLPCFLLDR